MINILRARVSFVIKIKKKEKERRKEKKDVAKSKKKKKRERVNEANGQGNREVTRRWGRGHDANAGYILEQFH